MGREHSPSVSSRLSLDQNAVTSPSGQRSRRWWRHRRSTQLTEMAHQRRFRTRVHRTCSWDGRADDGLHTNRPARQPRLLDWMQSST